MFACICVYHMLPGTCRGQKGDYILWKWSYRHLCVFIWVLGIEQGSSGKNSKCSKPLSLSFMTHLVTKAFYMNMSLELSVGAWWPQQWIYN